MTNEEPSIEQHCDIDPMMMDLFKVELETQIKILNRGLIEIEQQGKQYIEYEPLMRAAHSLKGAGRIVHMEPLISLTHSIEDAFVAAQKNKELLTPEFVDVLLKSVDLLSNLAKVPQSTMHVWINQQQKKWHQFCELIQKGLKGEAIPPYQATPTVVENIPGEKEKEVNPSNRIKNTEDRILRVTATNLNRLMGLAGEALVESRWLQPFYESLVQSKVLYSKLLDFLNQISTELEHRESDEKLSYFLEKSRHIAEDCQNSLGLRLFELEQFIIRNSQLSSRLYGEVVDSRMRPFSDCLEGFPRMVRDLAKELNKKVRLEINGASTPVDRDILEKLEAPLGHLLRNAVDHGIETPDERIAAGKPPEGIIKLEAQHRAGMLMIVIEDDGRGVDLEKLRSYIVEKKMVKPEMAQKLTEAELLDFLLLPGFSTAKKITDISGRGVGLNVVQNMVQEVAGSLRIIQQPGKGIAFYLQLPLTLSVIRALIVEISGDPYAFPLARVDKVLHIPKERVEVVEGRRFFSSGKENIGLIPSQQVLDLKGPFFDNDILSVVVFSDRHNAYGMIIDNFIGQREFVVLELDPRLKKIPDVYAGALMEDGSPIIILDVEDMVRSIDRLLTNGPLKSVSYTQKEKVDKAAKGKILVVDDSITVREVEARLLRNQGFTVEMAVNGMDGWNAVRMGNYDLVITDVDMPRMNGIELVRAIRNDQRLKDLPVMIVSYKEREEDRLLGMEAGANYYLTKSSFHDETMLNAVMDLIGK